MATVHYQSNCRDGFDDTDDVFRDPFAVADSGHSDVVRAANEYGQRTISADPLPRPSRHGRKRLHRLSDVRQQQAAEAHAPHEGPKEDPQGVGR